MICELLEKEARPHRCPPRSCCLAEAQEYLRGGALWRRRATLPNRRRNAGGIAASGWRRPAFTRYESELASRDTHCSVVRDRHAFVLIERVFLRFMLGYFRPYIPDFQAQLVFPSTYRRRPARFRQATPPTRPYLQQEPLHL